MYNTVLVSGIQQSDLVSYVCVSIPSQIVFHYRFL